MVTDELHSLFTCTVSHRVRSQILHLFQQRSPSVQTFMWQEFLRRHGRDCKNCGKGTWEVHNSAECCTTLDGWISRIIWGLFSPSCWCGCNVLPSLPQENDLYTCCNDYLYTFTRSKTFHFHYEREGRWKCHLINVFSSSVHPNVITICHILQWVDGFGIIHHVIWPLYLGAVV